VREPAGFRFAGREGRLCPPREAALEAVRVDQRQHAPEGVVRGDAIRQSQEAPEPSLLATAVVGDGLETLGLAEHGADRDHQDVDEMVLDLARVARVREHFEAVDQSFEHGSRPPHLGADDHAGDQSSARADLMR
jgi:hypothetical protein